MSSVLPSLGHKPAPRALGPTVAAKKRLSDPKPVNVSALAQQVARDGHPSENVAPPNSGATPAGRALQQVVHRLGKSSARDTARAGALVQLLRVELASSFCALLSGNATADASSAPAREVATEPSDSMGDPVDGALDTTVDAAESMGADVDAVHDKSSATRSTTALVASVTRWRRRLDFVISNLTERACVTLDPVTRQILRLGVYEVLFKDVEPWAISAHVELAKICVDEYAGGFVNAVLRNLLRQRDAGTLVLPTLPPPPTKPEDRRQLRDRARLIAIAHSHPTWMVARWLKAYGEADTIRLLEYNNASPTYSVRVNTALTDVPRMCDRLRAAGVEVEPSLYLPADFVRVSRGLQAVLRSGVLQEGLCAIQDEGAGLAVEVLDPQAGETVLDACAAPGGKAIYAAIRMQRGGGGGGRIVAADINQARLKMVVRAAESAGVGHIVTAVTANLCDASTPLGFLAENRPAGGQTDVSFETHAADVWSGESASLGRVPASEAEQFDKVLLDAPCSGLGVLGKRADLRWQRMPEDMDTLINLQRRLLMAAAQCVRPGGVLVYSTCSIEACENEEQIAYFLNRCPEFEIEPPPAAIAPQLLTASGFLSTLPFRDGIDGAFASRLRKRV